MQTMTRIDMLNPAQTCARLRVEEPTLLDMINRGEIAAYDLGDGIRFKVLDVADSRMKLMATQAVQAA